MTKRSTVAIVAITLLAASCGASPPEQAAEGDGWEHLGWHDSEILVPEQVQFFPSVEDFETATSTQIEQPSVDDFVLLLVNDIAGGCGPPVYAELSSTSTGLNLTRARDESGRACPDVAQQGFTVFAVSPSLLPDTGGQVTFERDSGDAPAQVTIDAPR